MVEEGTTAVALITAFTAGRIDLDKVLESLSKRGFMPEGEYNSGVETLRRLREERMLDDVTVTTLITRMTSLRDQADDATVVRPAASGGNAVGSDPAAARPSSPSSPPDDATQVRPAIAPAGGRRATDAAMTAGTGGTSATAADWESIAVAAAGESASVGMLLKGRFLLERDSLQRFLDQLRQVRLADRADLGGLHLATLEQQQHRDRAHVVAHRGGLVLVDVDLHDLGAARIGASQIVQRRRDHLAGSAPGGPEIDQHGLV